MTDTKDTAAGQRDRSPAFPVIGLEAALGKLVEFETHFKRTPARPEKVGEAWDINAKAYADRIAAALRYFGLLEYQGSGKDRSIVVSENGRKYLRAQQDELKREIAKAAALRPKQIAKHWNDWGADRPADAACLDVLMDEGFSEGGARDFLKVYDATITYARLSDSDKVSVPEGQPDDESEQSDMTPSHPQTTKQLPIPAAPSLLGGGISRGTRQEVITLDEGDVVISFPENLSAQSFGDLKDHLELFIKKMQRRTYVPPAVMGRPSPSTILGGKGDDDDEAA
jgi:hypothetical protein